MTFNKTIVDNLDNVATSRPPLEQQHLVLATRARVQSWLLRLQTHTKDLKLKESQSMYCLDALSFKFNF